MKTDDFKRRIFEIGEHKDGDTQMFKIIDLVNDLYDTFNDKIANLTRTIDSLEKNQKDSNNDSKSSRPTKKPVE